MKKSFVFILIMLVGVLIPVLAQTDNRINSEITFGEDATHIARITNDSLVVVGGSTYSFTVDTPEDQGLVPTTIGVDELLLQVRSKNGMKQKYEVTDSKDQPKSNGEILTGDRLKVTTQDGKTSKIYNIRIEPRALTGNLHLKLEAMTTNTSRDLTVLFTAGQRSPNVTVQIFVPKGIEVNMDNTTVNVIGRGDVKLGELSTQSIGRVGSKYSYSKVGNVAITRSPDGGSIIEFTNLDLRPANGADLKIVIKDVNLTEEGKYLFKAKYITSKPEVLESATTGRETAVLKATTTISDFERIVDRKLQYKELSNTYTQVNFKWSPISKAREIQLMQSLDNGKNWERISGTVDHHNGTATVSGLEPNKLYSFKLLVKGGKKKGFSNPVFFYSGKLDIKKMGVTGDGKQDDTEKINQAIDSLYRLGGGTLLFSDGIYNVRTVHLRSNVYLYVDKGAIIKALKGSDSPEATWFSDKQYRSGLSPTDMGPYENPENWLTKQDVGHTFFRNTMFFGERLDNVKIIGNGRITGDGSLHTSDKVMNNDPGDRADKMFTFKLCTNIEIGGLHREQDLWFDMEKDVPYYLGKNSSKDFNVDNMLHIDRGGHFVLLATGTDNINVHNTYFGKSTGSNARDIYDFMGCNNVQVTNIYSTVSSDDLVKLGSDVSLGFTRPASKFMVRNIIGDTNCNLFQIGSETADDIQDVHVDNIFVTGANKAGFSISTNDGAHIKDIHLNCGHTGSIHSRSKMYRTRAPFFISISNRARILGAEAGRFKFDENGKDHDELLITNVNIGKVENVILNGVDIYEVYGGSSFRDNDTRWKEYDGSQNKATPIVAGYQLPQDEVVEGGLTFTLPNGEHTGYIQNIVFDDVHVLVKGGNPLDDITSIPPELGVGQYNVSNLGVQPSYGLWVRHAKELSVTNSTFSYEDRDSRYAIFLDDVKGAHIEDVQMVKSKNNEAIIGLKNAADVVIEDAMYYIDEWGKIPTELPNILYTGENSSGLITIPAESENEAKLLKANN